MSDLLYSLKKCFKTNYIIIDNNMCRLHHKASVAILFAFSFLVTGKQYIGDPIDCVVPKDSINNKMLDTYCWIHKTFSIEEAFKKELEKEVAYPGVGFEEPGQKLVYHSYYQWVCFVLFLQALFFYAPRFLWKLVEGKRIHHLSCGLVNPVLDSEERDKQIKLVVDYMDANKGRHKFYFGAFVLTEVLYLINIIVQMYVMDLFLGGEFSTYGWKVAQFTEWHWEARYDPMIKVFPRMTKCTFRMYGTSGGLNRLDTICVLPINIINEKIYVFLWFWFVILTVITVLFLIYRVATIVLPGLRTKIMTYRNPSLDERIVDGVLNYSDAADWFVIYQVSKNINPLHMREFMTKYVSCLDVPEVKKLIESES